MKTGDCLIFKVLRFFTFQGEEKMINTQLEELQADSATLSQFAKELKKEGNIELYKKVKAKKEFLDEYIRSRSSDQILFT